MSPGEKLLHREKTVFKYHWLFAIFVLASLLATGAAAVGAVTGASPVALPLVGLIPTALFLFLWIGFAVLRVHLSDRELVVHVGPVGPRVKLGEIVSCEVRPRASGRFSYGKVRMNLDGTKLYSFMLPGLAERLINVVFERDGKRHLIELSSPDPDALARKINEARERTGQPAGAAVRVEVAPTAQTALAPDAESATAGDDVSANARAPRG